MLSQGHSGSIILESLESRQSTSWRRIIILASTLKRQKIWRPKLRIIARSDHPMHARLRLLAIEPSRISECTLYRLKVESMGYISASDSMGLIFFFQISAVSSERRIICAVECGTAVQGHPRSLILGLIVKGHAYSRFVESRKWKRDDLNKLSV